MLMRRAYADLAFGFVAGNINFFFLTIELVILIAILPHGWRSTALAAVACVVDIADPGVGLCLGRAEEDESLPGRDDSELHVRDLGVRLARYELDVLDRLQIAKDFHPVAVGVVLTCDEQTVREQEHVLLLDSLLHWRPLLQRSFAKEAPSSLAQFDRFGVEDIPHACDLASASKRTCA